MGKSKDKKKPRKSAAEILFWCFIISVVLSAVYVVAIILIGIYNNALFERKAIELLLEIIGVVLVSAMTIIFPLSIIIAEMVEHLRKSKGLFIFRRYKKFEGPPDNKQQHPKLIVEATDDEYGFMGLTEHRKHGKANNLPISNPKKGDNRESYIRKEVRHDSKDNFLEILKDYKLTRKDKKAILQYLENRKKK